MDRLARMLSEIGVRRVRAGAEAAASSAPRPTAAPRFEQLLPGCEWGAAGRACWLMSTPAQQVLPDLRLSQRELSDALAALGAERGLLLDIETGGLVAAPVFLVGVIRLDRWPLHIEQYLARDYPQEVALLEAVTHLARDHDAWVTFNGKTFDARYLAERAAVHRMPPAWPSVHVDLLHLARRRWRGRVPDCKLTTLEQHILGRRRVGDVPSADVPALFHHFIRTGAAGPLRPVIDHNRHDLVSCCELLVRLAAEA